MKDETGQRCIICGEGKQGLDVRDDMVIRGIRQAKHMLGMKTGYHLVVCKGCYARYYKARRDFERRRMLYIGLGLALGVVLVIVIPTLLSVVYCLCLAGFMYLLSLLTYMPALDIPQQKPQK